MERWPSGRRHQIANLAYSYRVPRVRIPPSPPLVAEFHGSPDNQQSSASAWKFRLSCHALAAESRVRLTTKPRFAVSQGNGGSAARYSVRIHGHGKMRTATPFSLTIGNQVLNLASKARRYTNLQHAPPLCCIASKALRDALLQFLLGLTKFCQRWRGRRYAFAKSVLPPAIQPGLSEKRF